MFSRFFTFHFRSKKNIKIRQIIGGTILRRIGDVKYKYFSPEIDYFLKYGVLKYVFLKMRFSRVHDYKIRKYIWNTDLYPNWYVPHGARILIQCQHDITYLAPSPATLCARVYIMRLNLFWRIHTYIKSSPCIQTRYFF